MSIISCQFIVYACPTGELNSQLEKYLVNSRSLYKKTAHKYMPYCTLTRFFTDNIKSTPVYIEDLERSRIRAKSKNLSLNITIKQLTFN